MTAVAEPDAWMETCLISLTELGSSASTDNEFAGITENIDIDIGEKQIDIVSLNNGGQLILKSPQTVTTITMEMYPLSLGARDQATVTEPGMQQIFDYNERNTEDVSEPLNSDNSRYLSNYQIVILWTTDVRADAKESTDADERAKRFQAVNSRLVSYKPSFADKILKYTAVFKVPAFDKEGRSNLRWQSVDGTSTLSGITGTYSGVLI